MPQTRTHWSRVFVSLIFFKFDYRSFIYSPIDALVSCLKKNIKIYIKNRHISVLQLRTDVF